MNTQRMTTLGSLGAVAAFAATAAAGANFVNLELQSIGLGGGQYVVNLYAKFSHANDRVLNVYNTNITGTFDGGFIQSGSNPFWKPGNTQNKNTSFDSWVAIGTNPNGSGNAGGNGGTVVADPNFVNFDDANESTDFSFIEGTGGGAGWYNGNPSNTYGYAFDNNRVLLAHFAVMDLWDFNLLRVNVSMTVSFNGTSGGSQVSPGEAVWFFEPTPGAMPLLALGLMAGRRRR